jgi:hypothetical protein
MQLTLEAATVTLCLTIDIAHSNITVVTDIVKA